MASIDRPETHRLYLSRTVAAEVCMEARQNSQAYEALKILDSEGVLLFQLIELVEDLVKASGITSRLVRSPNSFLDETDFR